MTGCDRCGHPKREHVIQGNQPGNLLCAHPMPGRLCLCPRYVRAALQPSTEGSDQ